VVEFIKLTKELERDVTKSIRDEIACFFISGTILGFILGGCVASLFFIFSG